VTTANIAILYQALGQYDRALRLYSGLLTSSDALEPRERAQLLSNAGALRRRLGDPVRALETYREAQALYRQSKHADGEITVLNNIGILQSADLGDFKGAEQSFTQAYELATKSGDRPLAVHAQLNRGEARFRAGHADASQADFTAVRSRAHDLGLKEEEWQALYGLSRGPSVPPAERHALLLEAVERIEALRANVGSNQLRSRFLADKRAVFDRLIETATSPEEAFRWMEQSRGRSLADTAKGQSTARSLREVQSTLPPDTAVLEFWVGAKHAITVWISAKGAGIKRWSPDLAAMSKARAAVSDSKQQDWRGVLSPIGQAAINGLAILDNPQIQHLRIIPDGPLTMLPFEALPLTTSKLLIERYSISYAPSANVMFRGGETTALVRWPWQKTFAALADPPSGADQTEGRSWDPLPAARTESRRSAGMLGGASMLREGASATKLALLDATSYPVVHLATHGQADPQDPERSFLLLAGTSSKHEYLYASEIASIAFDRPSLITLSACETNVGEFVPGEGLRAFPETFLAAGARSVLASLWSVGDRSTEELMTRFYSGLASGETPAAALRSAKLQFLRHPQSSHPAHWAAFVLTGDTAWKMPPLIGWGWLVGAPLACVAAVALVSKRRQERS
jgi:CHAT domain-containing protein